MPNNNPKSEQVYRAWLSSTKHVYEWMLTEEGMTHDEAKATLERRLDIIVGYQVGDWVAITQDELP